MSPAPDNWAVVIGIDQYDVAEACLNGAVNDALAMRKWLLDPAGGAVSERQLFLLLSPKPGRNLGDIKSLPASRANAITVIERVLAKSRGRGDRFFFHFSGHGLSARINATNQSGMAFADFTELLTDNSLTVQALFDLFQSTQFKEQFFFIDGCRNAPFGSDRILGSYPKPRAAQPPVSPQFGMYATAPMLKANEVDERGAFTQALLDGLGGEGSAKRWDSNNAAYVIRWSTLFSYVHGVVTARKLKAGAFIQTPRRFGETAGEDPILASKPPEGFGQVRLSVKLAPKDALGHSSVLVRDLSGEIKREPKPIKGLPVCFDLTPRLYGVDVEADGWERVGNVRSVDLYEPCEIDITLARSPAKIITQAGERRELWNDDTAESLDVDADESWARATSFSVAPSSLTVESGDRLATVEIADEAGRVLETHRWAVRLAPCPPGFYRARLLSPEGEATEELVQVGKHQSLHVAVTAPPPASPLLQHLIETVGFRREKDGTVSVSASVGPSASLRLSTVLALSAAAAAETGSKFGQRLRAVGIPAFSAITGAASGVQIVAGSDDGTDWIGRLRVGVWSLDGTSEASQALGRLPDNAEIATAAFARAPGACQLTLQDVGQSASQLTLPLVVLPGRVTLLVITRDRDGRIDVHLYMPAVTGPQAQERSFRDQEFADSNFAALRRIELMQRAVANGRISPTAPEIDLLLWDKWRDPVAGCLGGYLGRRRGDALQRSYTLRSLEEASANLVRFFGLLPDSHILHGWVLEQVGKAGAAASYAAALDAGLPLFRDGVALLESAVARLGLQHPRVPALAAIAGRPPADPLWSVTMRG
ncbi:hypothetical protein; putative caspase domain [Bradyrhizobium sp. ORS 278]|uniref:caspase family protein n=1 Tax=Bradyrhizobium sp. (strain ORS 278) TaxID=114615 RepID=UPI0001507C80|nr:caspase family protein [Bradyrhizobium sp. ORS 278]CAL75145.1 hypothetical protein; putative caspase domain [Bradyrhizobium sp. ORS 278]